MKNNKIFIILFLFFMFSIALYANNVSLAKEYGSSTTKEEKKEKAKKEAEKKQQNAQTKKYGYELTVLKYDGTGTPKQVGKPILVYQEGFLNTVEFKHYGNYPRFYNDLGESPVEQIDNYKYNLMKLPPLEGATTGKLGKSGQNDNGDGGAFEFSEAGECSCPNNITKEKKNNISGSCGTSELIKRFLSTDEKNIKYSNNNIYIKKNGKKVKLNDYYYKTYKDSGTAYDIAKKYATLNVLGKNFNIVVKNDEIDMYYVQVMVVQREFPTNDSEGTNKTRYLAWSGSSHARKIPTSWDSDGVRYPENDQDTKGKWKSWDPYCESPAKICNDNSACCTTTSYPGIYYLNIGEYESKGFECSSVYGGVIYNCTKESSESPMYRVIYRSRNDTGTGNPACTNGFTWRYLIFGMKYDSPSYIVPSTEYTGENNQKNKAKETCQTKINQHEIKDPITDKGTGKYLYYVGPDSKDALVVPSSVDPKDSNLKTRLEKNDKYPLVFKDAKWNSNKEKYTCSGDKAVAGIQHFYIPDFPLPNEYCQTACASIATKYTKSSPEYLACAEQYAESMVHNDTGGNPQKRKLGIIINNCGYSYGISPTDGTKTNKDRESSDSCNNSKSTCKNCIKGIAFNYNSKKNTVDLTSSCNMYNGKFVPDYKATNVSDCYGDYVTDFDGKNKLDAVFDQRKYINKVCKETTDFDYKNTSVLELYKGSGFTYPIRQEGEKECVYFFNAQQWMVDYASAPERDPDQRKRMLDLLNVFNKESNNSASDKKSDYVEDFVEEGYGKTNFEKEGFNFGETGVETNINENVIGKKEKQLSNDSMLIGKTSTDSLIKSDDNKTSTRLQTIGRNEVLKISNNKIVRLSANRYISVGEGKMTYTLEKVCISTDGLATINKPGSGDVCYEKKINETTKEVLAESKYYTSFQIDPNKENSIGAKVSVGKENVYYKGDEKCSYKVSEGKECKLLVEPNGNGSKVGNGQYKANELTVKLRYNIKSSDISSKSIIDNGVAHSGESITITKQANRTVTVHRLVGQIELKNGETVTCEETIDQYVTTPSCNVSCELIPVSNLVYELKSTGKTKATKFYSYTSNHLTPYFDILYKNNNAPYDFMKEVTPSVIGEARYIRLSSELKSGESLYGYVTSGDGCNNYCEVKSTAANDCSKIYKNGNASEVRNYCDKNWKSDVNDYESAEDCFKNCSIDCTNIYEPGDTENIHEYCKRNWTNDLNGYKDEEDCFKKCTAPQCPNNSDDLDAVKKFCGTYYSQIGFKTESLCLNSCYNNGVNTNNEYIFRSINVYDPFPNSIESDYENGARIVGKNWQFLSSYITDDSQDGTSVTGDQKNQKVEYIVDMSASDIMTVRSNTKMNGKSANETNATNKKRTVYARLDRIKKSSNDAIEEYKSQFLHNDFTGLFVGNHGSIESSFVP